MSFMDRKNILEEGIIDKLVKLLTKSKKSAKEKGTPGIYCRYYQAGDQRKIALCGLQRFREVFTL